MVSGKEESVLMLMGPMEARLLSREEGNRFSGISVKREGDDTDDDVG